MYVNVWETLSSVIIVVFEKLIMYTKHYFLVIARSFLKTGVYIFVVKPVINIMKQKTGE